MIATKPRQAKVKQKQECRGTFAAQRQSCGVWQDVATDQYVGENRRAALLKSQTDWAHGSTTEVRRCVEHCTIDGKPRHIIRAESAPTADIEPWSEVDLVLGMYNRQGVDYTEPSIQ